MRSASMLDNTISTKTFRSQSCSQTWRAHWDPGETDVEVRMEDKVLEMYHKSEP